MKELLEAVTVTAELTATDLSVPARVAIAEDLQAYPLPMVLSALARCRREIKGRLTVAEIIARLDDGRPGVEEAWALYPKDESGSAAVTNEMELAMAAAWPLVQDGDKVAGRMAFKEAYERIVMQNRANKVPVKWSVTFGTNLLEREGALVDAVQRKRIGLEYALSVLPSSCTPERFLQSAGATDHPLLAAPTSSERLQIEQNKQRMAEIVGELAPKTEEAKQYGRSALDKIKTLL